MFFSLAADIFFVVLVVWLCETAEQNNDKRCEESAMEKKEKKKQENEKLTNPTPCIAFGPCFIFFVYCLFRSLQLTNYTMLEVELDEIVNDRDLSNRHITTFFRRCFFCCFNNGKLLTNYTTLSRLLFLSTLKSVLLHTHT